MPIAELPYLLLGIGALLGLVTTYPYVATAIAYRHRDNGLAYILFALGVGVWSGLFAAQYLSGDPAVTLYFYSLSTVGALLAGLGWFLFASTASSTPELPARRPVFAGAAVLVGAGITLTMTSPVHTWYWVSDASGSTLLAAFVPRPGYWLHTGLLVCLFGAGTLLFGAAWRSGERVPYVHGYVVAGTATVLAVLGSNLLATGGLSVAPLVAVCLTTIGWLQAKRWRGLRLLRTRLAAEG